jgi:hypothetical protein
MLRKIQAQGITSITSGKRTWKTKGNRAINNKPTNKSPPAGRPVGDTTVVE